MSFLCGTLHRSLCLRDALPLSPLHSLAGEKRVRHGGMLGGALSTEDSRKKVTEGRREGENRIKEDFTGKKHVGWIETRGTGQVWNRQKETGGRE